MSIAFPHYAPQKVPLCYSQMFPICQLVAPTVYMLLVTPNYA